MYEECIRLIHDVCEFCIVISMAIIWVLAICALATVWCPRRAYARTFTNIITTICLIGCIIGIPIYIWLIIIS